MTTAGEEASLWLARLQRGLRDHEGHELHEWLKDSTHQEVILEMASLYHGADVTSVLKQLIPQSAEILKPRRWKRGGLAISITAAAAAAIVLFGAVALNESSLQGFFDSSYILPDGDLNKVYTTAIGETREVKLADNTSITLNTATRMSVVYSQKSREVNLMYGEASFDVAHDPARPFNVRAGRRAFEVMGTRFNVRVMTPEDVELTVTEGNVKVLYAPPRWPETAAQRRDNLSYGEATVSALETARVDPGFQSVRKIEASEVEARLAWRMGMLVFDGEFLEDVISEMDRYTTTKFVLADEKLRNVRIGGYFRAGDVDGLLRSLREKFRIDSRRDAQGRVVLMALNTP